MCAFMPPDARTAAPPNASPERQPDRFHGIGDKADRSIGAENRMARPSTDRSMNVASSNFEMHRRKR
jgi:hypothetical protein